VLARLTVRTTSGRVIRMVARWQVFAQPGRRAVISGSAGRAHLAGDRRRALSTGPAGLPPARREHQAGSRS
jgi:hypothetical protein